MSYDEWKYLLFIRRTNVFGVRVSNARFARVVINGVKGLIIFPDDFTWTTEMGNVPKFINESDSNIGTNWSSASYYSLAQAKKMEESGMVFLPAGGWREGSSYYNRGSSGLYWTSSPNNSYSSGEVCFDYYRVTYYSGSNRYEARAIRPVVRIRN